MAWPLLDLFEIQMTVCQVRSCAIKKNTHTKLEYRRFHAEGDCIDFILIGPTGAGAGVGDVFVFSIGPWDVSGPHTLQEYIQSLVIFWSQRMGSMWVKTC